MSAANAETVELPSHFTQPQLAGLKDIVNHHRENGNMVRFDAKEVERIDGAAVQFMVAVSAVQSDSDNQPMLVDLNEVVLKAFDDMGVHEYISIDPSALGVINARQDA